MTHDSPSIAPALGVIFGVLAIAMLCIAGVAIG